MFDQVSVTEGSAISGYDLSVCASFDAARWSVCFQQVEYGDLAFFFWDGVHLESGICVAERNAVCVFPCCSLGGGIKMKSSMVSKISKLGRECMFSGEVADSEEHVIPRWLQRRFSLSNQEVILPNQTTFRYAKAKVPVETEHNREFGKIAFSQIDYRST